MIPYNQRLVISLERSLREAFHQPDLRLHRPGSRKVPIDFRVYIENFDKQIEDDGGVSHLVKMVCTEDDETSFYFGFVGTFAPLAHQTCLQHASLTVFCDICAGELVSVFRAEWDAVAAADTTSRHAQPHWHFVHSPSRVEEIVKTIMSTTTQSEFAPDDGRSLFAEAVDFGKIHFSMTSLWPQHAVQPRKDQFDTADFMRWFRELTLYVGEQIDYVSMKLPTKDQEFDPTSA